MTLLSESPTPALPAAVNASLCGNPDDTSSYRLGILRDPDGRGSSPLIHDRLREGDAVRVRGPRNNFPLVASPRYLFIAGGIGITPILPMVRDAEAASAEWRLVYGGRARSSALLDEFLTYGDRVRGAQRWRLHDDLRLQILHEAPPLDLWLPKNERYADEMPGIRPNRLDS